MKQIRQIFKGAFFLAFLFSFCISTYATEIEINTGYEEADTAFQTFYDETKHMDNNSDWDNLYLVYQVYENTHAEQYAEICNSTVDDWKSKSNFERFILYETYVRVAVYGNLGDYDRYFSSEKDFLNHTISNACEYLNRLGDGAEAEAYKTLMLWQYDYILENGVPYNFLTGLNFVESRTAEATQEAHESQELEQKELEEIREELLEETAEYIESDNANDGDIFGKVILVIIVLCVGVLGIIIYRKKTQ